MTILKNIQENSLTLEANSAPQLTEDSLLGGRVRFKQPKEGFRVAIDSVFLSAAVQAEPNQTVLDVGAGVGAASLCLATRLPHIRVIGVELQREYVRLSFDNAKLNNMNHRVEVLQGDLLRPPPRLAASTYDHVMANPPYHESLHHASPNNGKATANHEGHVGLEQWIKFCLLMAKPKGMVTFVHKMDRLDEIMHFVYGKLGFIHIYPLWAGEKKEAKRFILQGIKGIHGPTHLLPGMVLHKSDGKYTEAAEDVLRHAKGIFLNTSS
jgi:tRNA1(Val) A37 N6-methylase TrmN6